MYKTTCLILCLSFLFLTPAFARGDGDGHRKPHPEMHKRMIKKRGKLLQRHLDLSEEKLQEVETILQNYDPQRGDLHKEKRAAHQNMRDLLQNDSNDQAAYKESLDQLRKAQEGLQRLRRAEMAELAQVLDPKEQARLFLALKKMKKRFWYGWLMILLLI